MPKRMILWVHALVKRRTRRRSWAYLLGLLAWLPVMDFNIEDIPVEDGIALLFQKQGVPDAVA